MQRILCISLLLLGLTFPAAAQRAVEEISDPEQLYLYAAGLLQRQYYDLAETQLRTFLQKFPDHARVREVHYQLIEALKRQQKSDAVLDELARFRQKWPAAAELGNLELLEATLYIERRDFQRAAELLRKLSRHETLALAEPAAYDLARCLLELKQDDEAHSLLAAIAARELSPDFPQRYQAAFVTGLALLRKQELEPAAAMFRRLSEATGTPPELRRQARERGAELARMLQRYDEALLLYNQILADHPDEPTARLARRWRLLTLYDKKEFARVCELTPDFRERYPEADDGEVTLIYADSLRECQRHGEALPFFQSAADDVRLPPAYRQYARYHLLTTLQALGRDQAALEAARQFLADFPNAPEKGEILLLIGRICRKLQQPEEAVASYRQALEAYIGEPQQALAAGHELWRYLHELGRFADAARVCRRLAKLAPAEYQARYRLQAALLSQEAGEDADVHTDLKEVLAGWPDDAAIRRQALEIYANFAERREDFDLAVRCLTALRGEGPEAEFDRWSLRLASALAARKEEEKAVAVLQEALQKPQANLGDRQIAQLFLLRLYLVRGTGDAVIMPLAEDILAWLPESKLVAAESQAIEAASLIALGKIFLRAGRLDAVDRFLALALGLSPLLPGELSEALGLQAEVRMRAGRTAACVELLQKGLQEHAEQLAESQNLLGRLAEAALLQKRYPLAFDAVERALRSKTDVTPESEVRSRYVMARLLFEADRNYTEAAGYALKCFIVSDDPVYSPRAMELAVEIALARKDRAEAQATWKELKQRYSWYVPAVKEP